MLQDDITFELSKKKEYTVFEKQIADIRTQKQRTYQKKRGEENGFENRTIIC